MASSNGGTTSQDLKTGYLVGATPYKQQWAIIVGSLASALVIAGTMLLLNEAGTHDTKKGLPERTLVVPADAPLESPSRPYTDDKNQYRVVHVRKGEYPDVKPGRYRVDENGKAGLLMGFEGKAPGVSLVRGKARVNLDIRNTGPLLTLADSTGRKRVLLGTVEEATALAITDPDANVRALLGVSDDDGPQIVLYDAKKTPVFVKP